jgi:hypothetical protein
MIISELCTNGDLFDYVRNVPPPSLHKVVSVVRNFERTSADSAIDLPHARRRERSRIFA